MDDIESIRKVTLGPGDVVVVRCESMGLSAIDGWIELLRRVFPDNRTLVLAPDMTLDVVSPEFIDKRDFKPEDVERWCKAHCGTANASKPLPKHDGKPLPSSVDKLKAREAGKGDVVGELLDAIEAIGPDRCLEGLTGMNRLHAAAAAVRKRRDELPEPMEGHR